MSLRTNKLLLASLVPVLLMCPLTANAQTTKCNPPPYMMELLLGESQHSITTELSPFQAMTEQPRAEKILWMTDQKEKHGLYDISIQANQRSVAIVAIDCSSLTLELETTLEAARQILTGPIPLSPNADFFQQMGLSIDQVSEIQRIAFKLANKAQPKPAQLNKTLMALANQILEADETYTSRALTKAKEKQYHIQTVFFGTTRAKSQSTQEYYSGKRDIETPLHLGRANVSIPFSHKKGSVEQPFLSLEWLTKDDEHVVIQSVTELQADQFWPNLPVNKGKGEWKNSMIVYVHGFNVTFDAAIKRTAQMAFDFEYSGVPMLFSWPSDGSLMGYASDREDAIWSATHFADFLSSLRARNPDSQIHLVAHSMGNQVLLNALNELSLKQSTNDIKFGKIILAAPDVDSEWFKYQLAPRITRLAEKWAIYTSKNDGALMTSEKVNHNKRLGMPGSFVANIDTIDTSGLNAAPWSIPESHSYYANKLHVIEDLVKHLQGVHPSKRNLTKTVEKTDTYWKLAEE